MRIAVDARPLTHPTTGIGRYTRALLKRFAGASHEFVLYSHAPVAAELSAGFSVRNGNIASAVLSTAYAQTHFGRWAGQDRADLFWSPRHHLPGGLGGIPSVVTIHDLVWRVHPETMIRLGRFVESVLMPRALGAAAEIIAVSAATARDIVLYYPDTAQKVTVVHEAADLEPAGTGCERGTSPYLLFVGTLEPRKNLRRVLEAFSRVIASGVRSHRLLIAGNAGWKNRALSESLRLTPQVEVLGSVDDVRLAQLYTHADALIAPSLFEGFGLPVVEAMRFGVPVITSTASSLPEVAGDAALLVDPYSVDAIADAMREIIDNPDKRAELAKKGRARAQLFSWEAAAAATLTVFERAVASRA